MSSSQPTYHDAELILKLYDLRREAVMREARNFVATLSPNSADDLLAVVGAFGTKESAYARQVFGYWDMAAALIVHGTLNPELAYDTLPEMFFVYSIVQPFLDEFRQKFGAPEFLKSVQQVVEGSAQGKERIAAIKKRRAEMMKRAGVAKQGS
jgi:hypothetical protein